MTKIHQSLIVSKTSPWYKCHTDCDADIQPCSDSDQLLRSFAFGVRIWKWLHNAPYSLLELESTHWIMVSADNIWSDSLVIVRDKQDATETEAHLVFAARTHWVQSCFLFSSFLWWTCGLNTDLSAIGGSELDSKWIAFSIFWCVSHTKLHGIFKNKFHTDQRQSNPNVSVYWVCQQEHPPASACWSPRRMITAVINA